ncbi:uncharacterized protein LOC135395078 [Ornithodoros turicata]|uniref:uncharacterized protein LOC135395078 n=1 Tax=Ornithodoros turicata TaxID=34597 RepID=UPI003139E8D5
MNPSPRKRKAAALVVALLHELLGEGSERSPKRKRPWVKAISKAHSQVGAQNSLLPFLRLSDFRGYLRISSTDSEELISGIREAVECEDTLMRPALTVEEQLTITLRFLATGESFHSIRYQYCVGTSTINNKVKKVCGALCDYLIPRYMRLPATSVQWEEVADKFFARWHFPHCLGALDGKHVRIRCPPKAGSSFFNYKGHHSIVLMALVDADKKAIFVDAGVNGRCNESITFRATELFRRLDSGDCNIPQPVPLPGQTVPAGFAVIADAAFPLTTYLLRPYAQKDL